MIELAISMVIIAILATMVMRTGGEWKVSQNRALTEQRLKTLDAAMTNFVTVNKRLPCPADGTLVAGAAQFGIEAPAGGGSACTASQLNGVVPWVTLGIGAADALDAWDNQFTYRVAYGLTAANALDMTLCDPAGSRNTSPAVASPISVGLCDAICVGNFVATNCTPPSNFLTNKGLDVSTGTTKVMDYTLKSGAAYIVISHGENGYGALTASGLYVANPLRSIAGTTLENANRNIAPSLVVTNAAPPQFLDAPYNNGTDAATYFDDLMIRPSILSLANKAQLGPRSH